MVKEFSIKLFTTLALLGSSVTCLTANTYGEIYPVQGYTKVQPYEQQMVYRQPAPTREYVNYNTQVQQHPQQYVTPYKGYIPQENMFVKPKQNVKYNTYKYGRHSNINDTILELANKLLNSSRIDTRDLGEIAITSFVDLHKLNKTTNFGRTLSESMFDELFIRGFNVSEFRGQNTLAINGQGEYFITRDVRLLNKSVPNKYILVGTYTNVEDNVLINSRIINNTTGKIVASARAYYNSDDCSITDTCRKPRKLKIVTDGCSSESSCPKRSCPSGICGENITYAPEYIKKSAQKRDMKISSISGILDQETKKIKKRTKDMTISLIK
jgi:TolB-like protein